MQQFLGQLQQLFSTTGGAGPVNWDLARQVAQAALTGTGMSSFAGFTGPPPEAPAAAGDPALAGPPRGAGPPGPRPAAPLPGPAAAALLPANIASYGDGLQLPADEVRLYVALREAAHQRLFGHVPWLRGHVLTAVEAYAAGIRVNRDAIEEAMGRFDPGNPESMQDLSVEGIFTPDDTPQQQSALARLETALALVEGWVCHVVDSAAGDRLPSVVRLGEAFRRRRAAGRPAGQTFAPPRRPGARPPPP